MVPNTHCEGYIPSVQWDLGMLLNLSYFVNGSGCGDQDFGLGVAEVEFEVYASRLRLQEPPSKVQGTGTQHLPLDLASLYIRFIPYMSLHRTARRQTGLMSPSYALCTSHTPNALNPDPPKDRLGL